MLSSLVIAVLAAAPQCQRAVLVPLLPVATTPKVARALEQKTRETLEATPGLCLESRNDTVMRLLPLEGHRLATCRDAACHAQQLASFGVDVLIEGLVLGAGGEPTLELTITRAKNSVRAVGSPDELPALIAMGLTEDAPPPKASGAKWPSILAGAAGLASVGVGVGLGVSSSSLGSTLSMNDGACTGITGATLATCLDGQLRSGKDQATAANVLFAIGGTLLVGAIILWVVELP
ncbi:MAG: hypothetical protein QM817_25585 [Archangium sp.]